MRRTKEIKMKSTSFGPLCQCGNNIFVAGQHIFSIKMKFPESLAVFIIVYVAYYLSAFSTITGGDSGELLAEACQLGTAHPPGYPLFTMVSHVMSLIHVPRVLLSNSSPHVFAVLTLHEGNVAWRINHLCCILGAITAALVCASGNKVLIACGNSNVSFVSTIGGLTYAFTPLIWEYSITAEVFALNNFLCGLLLYVLCSMLAITVRANAARLVLLSKDDEQSVFTLAVYGGICCGLALANQHSSLLMVAYVVPCVLITVWVYAKTLFVQVLLRAALGFLGGFSTYFYLPWAAQIPTPGSWGILGTWEGFMRHVLRAEYGTFRLGMIVGSETALERIVIYLQHTSKESYHLLFLVMGFALLVYCATDFGAMVTSENVDTNSRPVEENAPPKGAKRSSSKNIKPHVNVASLVPVKPPAQWNAGKVLLVNLVAMWLFYVLVWHCVLSNLPLSAPMPFAVHSRFWMQPNIILYTLMSAATGYIADILGRKVPVLISATAQGALVVVFLSVILYHRWPEMDKSNAGDVLHRYASAKLASILPSSGNLTSQQSHTPVHSLLLSHTDLDWNPVRYLQHCEGVGRKKSDLYKKSPLRQWYPALKQSDVKADEGLESESAAGLVTHLSFQLIPYPWFQLTQASLYPHVVFPSTNVAGISSDRASEGNAQMILRFLRANAITNQSFVTQEDVNSRELVLRSAHPTFTGGVYLDMQAVNDPEIEPFGQWRGLVLVPWGTLYRVFGPLHMDKIQELHLHSYQHLRALQARFPSVDDTFVQKFAPGSWERAAANVYYDAHYQFALNLLTFAMEAQGRIEMKILPILLDRYYVSASVLKVTLLAVRKYGTFSSSLADLTKNTALAWMRLHALMDVVGKFRKEVRAELSRIPDETDFSMRLLDRGSVLSLCKVDAPARVARDAAEFIGIFLREYPHDRDAEVFSGVYSKLVA